MFAAPEYFGFQPGSSVCGRALMNRVEAWAKEKGIREIRLNSGGTRKEAHEFYRAIGFADENMQVRFLKEVKEE